MKIKAALLDFDGTLVTEDILDVLAETVGKGKECTELNEAFHRRELQGQTALIKRINLLSGMTKTQIAAVLTSESYLMLGVIELIAFFKLHKIITVLVSGNILPVLEYYQRLLGIDYVVGSTPHMDGETIVGIDESAFSSKTYKRDGAQQILHTLRITAANVIALGDSPGDKNMFELSSYAIAVNPKGDIAEYADVVVNDDLREVVKLLEKVMSE